jgi:hypothetical protein
MSIPIAFHFHVDDGLAEQDVFLKRQDGVFRASATDQDLSVQLYAAASPVPHNPLDVEDTGPWQAGRPLGLTLGDWFAAEGIGTYTCDNAEGHLAVDFTGLVPNGVYTIWHYFMAWPPTVPFIGTYDLPIGARDGSQAAFIANETGAARFDQRFRPCLQLTGEHLASGLAIAWHSDGNTYGARPGDFGTVTHIQLYTGLPTRSGL